MNKEKEKYSSEIYFLLVLISVIPLKQHQNFQQKKGSWESIIKCIESAGWKIEPSWVHIHKHESVSYAYKFH